MPPYPSAAAGALEAADEFVPVGWVSLAGARLRLEVRPASHVGWLLRSYREFLVARRTPPGTPVLRLDVVDWERPPAPPAPAPGENAFECLDGLVVGTFAPGARVTTVTVPSWLLQDETRRAFDHLFIPHFYTYAAGHEGEPLAAMIAHASAVEIEQGVGVLCMAPSEGGKTTVARLAMPRPIVHEEAVIVRLGRTVTIEPGPWGGIRTQIPPRRIRLAGMFLLEKGPQHVIEAAPRAEAQARLLAQLVMAQGLEPRPAAEVLSRMMDFAGRLMEVVPLERLRFAREPSVWQAIRGHLRADGRLPRGNGL
ncbi:MAG: hypothetical protein KBD01_03835 [Acidobacteria bacterium]|nr:hypothetical protein [Acidobacteriota bacterium]